MFRRARDTCTRYGFRIFLIASILFGPSLLVRAEMLTASSSPRTIPSPRPDLRARTLEHRENMRENRDERHDALLERRENADERRASSTDARPRVAARGIRGG